MSPSVIKLCKDVCKQVGGLILKSNSENMKQTYY